MGHWLQLGHFLGKMWEMWDLEENPDFCFGGFGDFGIWVRVRRRILVGFRLVGDGVPFSSFFCLWGNLSGFLQGWVVVGGGGLSFGLL